MNTPICPRCRQRSNMCGGWTEATLRNHQKSRRCAAETKCLALRDAGFRQVNRTTARIAREFDLPVEEHEAYGGTYQGLVMTCYAPLWFALLFEHSAATSQLTLHARRQFAALAIQNAEVRHAFESIMALQAHAPPVTAFVRSALRENATRKARSKKEAST